MKTKHSNVILVDNEAALILVPENKAAILTISQNGLGKVSCTFSPEARELMGPGPFHISVTKLSKQLIFEPTEADAPRAIAWRNRHHLPLGPLVRALDIPTGKLTVWPLLDGAKGSSAIDLSHLPYWTDQSPEPKAAPEPTPNAASWAPPEAEAEPEPEAKPEPQPGPAMTRHGITSKRARELAALHRLNAEDAELLAIHPRGVEIILHNEEMFEKAVLVPGMPSINYWKQFTEDGFVIVNLPAEATE